MTKPTHCLLPTLLLTALFLTGASLRVRAAEPISGITEPFLDVGLSAPVAGIISAEYFKEGQAVKKGDVILQLDSKLEEFETSRYQAVAERAKLDLDSTRVLVQTTKAISQDELNKKETDYKVAAAEHGVASEQLARRRIVAPFSGSISEITLQPGSACSSYQTLARLVDTSRFYFVGHVEGKAVLALHPAQPVRIEVEGVPGSLQGRICFVSPVVDPASGLARIKAIFDNPDGRIRPGLAAKITPQ
jgi:RND family efflux transporter MFP subunit